MGCTAPTSLCLDLAAEPASVSVARHALADFVARRAVDHPAIEVAVSEAVSNAVVHAYRESAEPGRIAVRAAFDATVLHVEVIDTGVGMRPRADSPGLGLGLPLIAQLAAHLDITSDGGTRVKMAFAVRDA
jgi:anti-sigma regulatory factor (Ser/Thr protein kinase)